MNYEETVKFLYSLLPAYQLVGKRAYKSDLTNIRSLCQSLNNPHKDFKSIHVAGTNGKGSVSNMIASIFSLAGYKTGLFTSPHLKEFTERIKINGVEISKDYVVDFVENVHSELKSIVPSFFEMTATLAFDYFAHSQVDIAIIEVGLGGRLDSTNIISPQLSVITNIALDHTNILGDTLEKIAIQKAGIIKSGVPVVIGERQSEVENVFIEVAKDLGSQIYFASDFIKIDDTKNGFNAFLNDQLWLSNIKPDLKGMYQKKNISTVLQAVHVLRLKGYNISDEVIIEGIERTCHYTGFKGRWQKLGENPTVICDTCHNPAGVREAMTQIQQMNYNKLHIVFGMVKEKDSVYMLSQLPKDASYYFCHSKIPRALDSTILAQEAKDFGLFGKVIADVNDAIAEAKRNSTAQDLIFVCGSNFVIAEIENL